MDNFICECCNKKIRKINNQKIRNLVWEFNKEKLCKSFYNYKNKNCYNNNRLLLYKAYNKTINKYIKLYINL